MFHKTFAQITEFDWLPRVNFFKIIFSSPVQSTGRAIVLTLASAFALPLPFPSRHF